MFVVELPSSWSLLTIRSRSRSPIYRLYLPPLFVYLYLPPRFLYLSSPSQTEQLRLFLEPVWAVAAEAEFSQAVTSCQRLVEETERVGEEGGGKFRSSSTATPTLLRRVNMQEAATHLLLRGLYFSMEFRLELPSFPPTAYSQPSIATRSWVLLEDNRKHLCCFVSIHSEHNDSSLCCSLGNIYPSSC